MRYRETQCRVAPVSKDGAAPWFETPRTRAGGIWVGLRSRLLTMRAERSRVCVKLIGIRFSRGKPCLFAEKSYKASLPLDPGRGLNGRLQTLSSIDLESMRQGLLARRPVFPPSEHSSLSRKGFEGLRAGASAIEPGKGIPCPSMSTSSCRARTPARSRLKS